MWKVSALAAALLLSAPAHSEDAKLDDLVDALMSHMAATYVCRDAIGGLGHYHAARSIAVNTLAHYAGQDEAVLFVDKMDQKFRNDPRAQNPNVDDAHCLDVINEGLHRISVEKAKLAR